MKFCIACGRPMTTIADYPLFDISKRYCKGCANSDGSMLSFDDCLRRLVQNLIERHAMDQSVAEMTAKQILRKLPAWKPLR